MILNMCAQGKEANKKNHLFKGCSKFLPFKMVAQLNVILKKHNFTKSEF